MKKITKYTATLGIVALILGAGWLLTPVVHKVKHLCPVRPDGVHEAHAVSQFTRKYNMSCTACHTAFPRLTPFAERFKANGYQMPDSEDGDEVGKTRSSDSLVIDQLGNLFGLRIAMNLAKVTTNTLDKEGDGTSESTQVNFDTADWLQFFTAGSIYKNTSIFIETEISATANNTVKNNWFYLGWHNIVGQNGALNARIGNIPQADWHVMSGRLRMIPNIKIEAISNRKSSEGAPAATPPEDQVGVSGAYPGVEIFGLPRLGSSVEAVYSVGATQGKKQSNDTNELQNVFGTVGLRKLGGDFDGSQISVFGKNARDSQTAAGVLVTNNWRTVSPGINVRYKNVDTILSYFYSEDDNGNLSPIAPMKIKSNGIGAQIGVSVTPSWWAGVQYDLVDSVDLPGEDYEKITPTVWFFPKENLRVGVVGRVDVQGLSAAAGHPQKEHELLVHIRSMF